MDKESLRSQAVYDECGNRFLDPITLDVMVEPVKTADGMTYDRNSILAWFETLRSNNRPLVSPLTNLLLPNDRLEINETLARELHIWRAGKRSSIQGTDVELTLSSDIYKDLDKISDMPEMKDLDLKPPKIVVIGNESHGKSTILERIIGLPIFPKEKGICTRCIVRVHLRRCPANEVSIAEIRIVGRGGVAKSPTTFAALDNIREKIKEVMDTMVATDQHRRIIIDDEEIVVKINLPYCLNIDLLDVPGLVTTSPLNTSQNVPEVTRNLALRVIAAEKDSSIFLLVNDIRVPPNQSNGCSVIEQSKVIAQTFGIFTKLDMFVSEDGNEAMELESTLAERNGSAFPVGYGWMVVASRKPPNSGLTALQELKSLQRMDENELELAKHCYPRLKAFIGIANVRRQIQGLYDRFIKENWITTILNKLETQSGNLINQLKSLGLPVPPDSDYQKYQRLLGKKLEDNFFASRRTEFEQFFSVQFSSICTRLDESPTHPWIDTKSLNCQNLTSLLQRPVLSCLSHHPDGKAKALANQSYVTPTMLISAKKWVREVVLAKLEEIFTFLESVITPTAENIAKVITFFRSQSKEFNLSRFPMIEEQLKSFISQCFELVSQLFRDWCKEEIVEKLTEERILRCYLFKHEGNIPRFEFGWETTYHIQTLHYTMIEKWYSLYHTYFPMIREMNLQNVDITENCKEERIRLFRGMIQVAKVKIAVQSFSERVDMIQSQKN